MPKNPTVSILMPLYNHQDFVEAAIESVISQSYTKWELIICNDGSSDNSLGVASKYLSNKIKIINKLFNSGVSDALNSAALISKGSLICWLSSDDFFHPDKLASHVKLHQEIPNCQVSIGTYANAEFNATSKDRYQPIRNFVVPEYKKSVSSFLYGNYVNGLTVCYTRTALAHAGVWCSKYPYVQDVHRWISLFRQFKPEYIESDEALSVSRVSSTSNMYSTETLVLDQARMLYNEIILYGPFAYAAGLQPHSILNSITNNELELLYISCKAMLDENNYLGVRGLHGDVINALIWWFKRNPKYSILDKLIEYSLVDDSINKKLTMISNAIKMESTTPPQSSLRICFNFLSNCDSERASLNAFNYSTKAF